MKRFLVTITSFLVFLSPALAAHIKGGEVFYEYLGSGSAGNDRFRITVRLYIDCSSQAAQIDANANVGIYRIADNVQVAGSPFTLDLSEDKTIRLKSCNINYKRMHQERAACLQRCSIAIINFISVDN